MLAQGLEPCRTVAFCCTSAPAITGPWLRATYLHASQLQVGFSRCVGVPCAHVKSGVAAGASSAEWALCYVQAEPAREQQQAVAALLHALLLSVTPC